MSVLPQITEALTAGLGDSLGIAAFALAAYVAFFVFKAMRGAVSPQSITRHGETYVLDETFEKKLPKYQYFEGQRYVLKEPADEAEPYEIDSDQPGLDEIDDQIWDNAVENSRREFNGEDFVDHHASIDQDSIDGAVDDFIEGESDEDDAFEEYNNRRMKEG